MMQYATLEPQFVEFIPDSLQPGKIYVSMTYATAAHKCCCGCGEEVVTPFSPTDWKLAYDGVNVSLWPSVGNWNFKCRSHYIVRDGRVIEAEPWSDAEVSAERLRDRRSKAKYFEAAPRPADPDPGPARRRGPVKNLIRWLSGR